MLLKIGSQRTSFSGLGSDYAHPLDGSRQGVVVIKTFVALAVECATAQLLEFRDIVQGGAVHQILITLTIYPEPHAAAENPLIGSFESGGVRREFPRYVARQTGSRLHRFAHELRRVALLVFGLEQFCERLDKLQPSLLAPALHIPF